jgi:septum formation protein
MGKEVKAGNRSLVLASSSPRRADLLSQIGVAFRVVKPDVDESSLVGESPGDYVLRVARAKAGNVQLQARDELVLAADTAVELDGKLLVKPVDRHDAETMLTAMSGGYHDVITALVLGDNSRTEEVVTRTCVRFRKLTAREIRNYCATEEPYDKAGSYAIQGFGGCFVKAIEGSYSSVVGLPLAELVELLEAFGFAGWSGGSSHEYKQRKI